MSDERTYKVGQVWERDGKQREIVELITRGGIKRQEVDRISVFNIRWARPGKKPANRYTWCGTWNEWASKATLTTTPDRKDK